MLAEKLKLCRKKRGKTQKDITSFLGISERGYQNYEMDQREPNLQTLKKLADYFNVSTDYLLGHSDDPTRL